MKHFSHSLSAGLGLAAAALLLLSGCDSAGDGDDGGGETPPALRLSMDLPDSLTGGRPLAALSAGRAGPAATGEPCAFNGADEDDPLRNGYEMTKFMVSAVAAWTCIGDTLIDIAAVVPNDGVIRESDNDLSAPGYDPDDPTHYSVSEDSPTQTTIRMYYGFERSAPPSAADDPGFFISWHREANGDLRGRLVIAAADFGDRDPDDPSMMRMDFTYTDAQQSADVFLRFDDGNEWAEGFRIEVTRDLTASPLGQVFTARGLVAMKSQFAPVPGISEQPDLRMYTVSDRIGEGAAIAMMTDLALPLELAPGNHLGDYLFDKTDRYFFDDDQSWDYVNKAVSAAEYRGNRTTPASGGTWEPFDPSLDLIVAALMLDADYFANGKCESLNEDCTALLAAIFDDGFADQEPNQGSDPGDWRSNAIAGATYLPSVYPNGINWQGAFEPVFTP